MGTFSVFEHTADMGLEVRGDSWEDLLATAARAVFAQMLVDMPAEVEAIQRVVAEPARGLRDDVAERFVVWLQELLYIFDTQRLAPLEFAFDAGCHGKVCAEVGFGRFDPARHRTGAEIKAVTYHDLDVHKEPDGTWKARFIIDI